MSSSSQQATGKIQTSSSPAVLDIPGLPESLSSQLNNKSKICCNSLYQFMCIIESIMPGRKAFLVGKTMTVYIRSTEENDLLLR